MTILHEVLAVNHLRRNLMRLRHCLFFLALLTIFTAPLASAAQDIQMQVRVYFSNEAQRLALNELHTDIVYRGKGFAEIITHTEELRQIEQLGLKTETIHEDIVAFYKSRLADKDMGGYKTLSEINDYLDQMITDHPGIMSAKVSLGQSLEGRDIWAVKISDNPEIDEDEPEILYTAAIHAREVITPEVLFYFMDYLTNNYGTDPEAAFLVDNREMWFVPVINVDGYYHNQVIEPTGGGMWRKNRRDNGNGTMGVDLNRNYGYQWGFDNSGSSPYGSDETYRGTGPFSEPESQVMRDFIESRQFDITLSYHSYSNLILWPWGYDYIYTSEENVFNAIGDSLSDFNNYNPTVGWGLYAVNGSTDDWGYGEQTTKNKNYAFTFEVGSYTDGFWPSPSRIPQLTSENLEPNKLMAKWAGNVYGIFPPGMPTMLVDDTAIAPEYTVGWVLDDTLNPAVQYELQELKNSSKITDICSDFGNFDNSEFTVNVQIYHSATSSFYSGAEDNDYRYFQTKTPYPVKTMDNLTFWTRYNIELDWDYAYVEISSDGINFSPIPGDITTNFNPNGNNRGNGITGSSGGWVQANFDLSAYDGQSLYFRFSYETDQSLTESGIYFDDIYPVYGFEYDSILASDISGTSYNVTDHEAGLYYYRVRGMDADGQWGTFSDPAGIQVVNNYICGDINDDEGVDILDIIYLIDYKFKGGPDPIAAEAANVDGVGGIDILDIIYLIDFKFKGGPDLICP